MIRVPEGQAIDEEADARRFHQVMGSNRVVQREYRQFAKLAVGQAQPMPTAMLDVGTGPGYVALELARIVGAQASVIGVDLSPAMLRLAEAKARAAGLAQQTSWRLADAASLPFASGTFDLVVSSGSLHHWSDAAAVLREIERVLKPEGRCYVRDSKRVQALGARAFAAIIGLGVPSDFRYHYWGSIRSSYTPDEARALLARAGLHGWRVEEDVLDLVLLRPS